MAIFVDPYSTHRVPLCLPMPLLDLRKSIKNHPRSFPFVVSHTFGYTQFRQKCVHTCARDPPLASFPPLHLLVLTERPQYFPDLLAHLAAWRQNISG